MNQVTPEEFLDECIKNGITEESLLRFIYTQHFPEEMEVFYRYIKKNLGANL